MYQQLAGQKLKDGSDLNIIVFPASLQQDILPEVQRLNCSWVLQLSYHTYVDDDASGQGGTRFDSLLFPLWNGATQRVVENGSGFAFPRRSRLSPYATFSKQILKALNQLH